MSATDVHEFELPNAGAGPDPLALSDLAADSDTDAVVLLFQRDYYCGNCRTQVQAVADRYDEFEAAGAAVVSLLPEPVERAADWQDSYDLPFPLLADPEKAVADAYDQPTRFGWLGNRHDLLGRMPQTVVLDLRDAAPSAVHVHRGSSPTDRPTVDELLEIVGSLGESGA